MHRADVLYNCEILEKCITWNHYILDNSYYAGGNNVFNLYLENALIVHNFIPIIRQQQCMLAKMTNDILSIPLHNSDTNVIDYINGLL